MSRTKTPPRTPAPWQPYRIPRDMQAALDRVKSLRPAQSYGERLKGPR